MSEISERNENPYDSSRVDPGDPNSGIDDSGPAFFLFRCLPAIAIAIGLFAFVLIWCTTFFLVSTFRNSLSSIVSREGIPTLASMLGFSAGVLSAVMSYQRLYLRFKDPH